MSMSADDGSLASAANSGEDDDEVPRRDQLLAIPATNASLQLPPPKKRRNLPGTPDPTAEVIALSPAALMATNRFVCEICHKGFQRDQNLQLHRRGHNLPWKLRQRTSTEVKKRVYICPEPGCVHHNPARALGDLTGIKKHFSRKHGEKKWKCDKCSKKYAVQSDWKAHQKTCGTREYKCDCGTIFSRRDSFITHRAFCDALAEENSKVNQGQVGSKMAANRLNSNQAQVQELTPSCVPDFGSFDPKNCLKSIPQELVPTPFKPMLTSNNMFSTSSGAVFPNPPGQDSKQFGGSMANAYTSATALLQKAAQMGATASNAVNSPVMRKSYNVSNMAGTDETQAGYVPMFGTQSQHQPFQSQQLGGEFGASDGSSAALNEQMSMFNGLFMSGLAQEDSVNAGNATCAHMVRSGPSMTDTSMSRLARNGDLIPTVDFLGVGGSRPSNLQHQERQQDHQQQQEGINGIPFQQDMGKPTWDV